MSESAIPFVVEVESKGGRGIGVEQVPIDTLRASLKSATAALGEVFKDITAVGNYKLSEVTIEFEVTAEGGVQFIGTSKVGAKGAVSLKFVPPV
jgi:hypothetical protein